MFVLVFRQAVDVIAPSLVLRAIISAGLLFNIAVAWTVIRVADLFFDHLLERSELYLPHFPEPAVAALRGSLPYPPEGAPG
jgi:hypothetical protein